MGDDFLGTAVAAATAAGALLRSHLGRPLDVQHKGTVDLVTEADRAAEALIAARLRGAFPDHRLLGEEGAREDPAAPAGSPYRWLIDPLDGTTNFAHGLPHFAVSIGLEDGAGPLAGVVYDPMRDELFTAARGGGAFRNGQPLAVSGTDDLVRALLVTGFSYDLRRREAQAAAWRDFLVRVQGIRQTGSAALNLCYVAAGRLDGYWEWGIAPWDVAAGALIVAEAGGAVSDFGGGPFHADNRQLVASNGRLHRAILDVLADHPLPSGG